LATQAQVHAGRVDDQRAIEKSLPFGGGWALLGRVLAGNCVDPQRASICRDAGAHRPGTRAAWVFAMEREAGRKGWTLPMAGGARAPTAPFEEDELPTTRTVRRQAVADDRSTLVPAAVPLDAIPFLAVPTRQVPWKELGHLARQLLLRVDGGTSMMAILMSTAASPTLGAQELGRLASRGLLRWQISGL